MPTLSIPDPELESHEFQLRTNYVRFDDNRAWCATPTALIMGSLIKMRPCRAYSNETGTVNLQIWKRNNGRIQLARPTTGEDWCMYKSRMNLFLETCGPSTDPDTLDGFKLDDNEHTLKFIRIIDGRPSEEFVVVYDVFQKFSKLRFDRLGSLNPSMDQWETHYIFGPDDYT